MSQTRLQQEYPVPGEVFDYLVENQGETVRVSWDRDELELAIWTNDANEGWCRTPDGYQHRFLWTWTGDHLHLWLDGDLTIFESVGDARQAERGARTGGAGGNDVLAPMPGSVERILVEAGDPVERGQTLIIMESMKMELEIAAHRAGVVKQIPVEQGAQVDKGMRLVELEESS